jgi:glycosyltransferase involved in cell wall biosynthesis
LEQMTFLREIAAVRQVRARDASRPVVGLPRFVESFWNSDLADRIAHLCRSRMYDWMLVEHSYAAPYAEKRSSGTRVALTVHNVEYRLLEQIAPLEPELELVFRLAGRPGRIFRSAGEQVAAMRAFEQDAWRSVELRAVVSPIEEATVAEATRTGRTVLVPNCPSGLPVTRRESSGSPRIVFIGALNYLPNVDAVVRLVREVIPGVRRRFSELEVMVAGRDPEPALVDFCEQSNVRVVANPERLAPLCTEQTVLVAPLRFGGGTRIKLLDALTLGLPVVATPFAAEGLGLVDGCELLLGSTSDELAAQAIVLLSSVELRARLRVAGQELLASSAISWTRTFGELEVHLEAEGAEVGFCAPHGSPRR